MALLVGEVPSTSDQASFGAELLDHFMKRESSLAAVFWSGDHADHADHADDQAGVSVDLASAVFTLDC